MAGAAVCAIVASSRSIMLAVSAAEKAIQRARLLSDTRLLSERFAPFNDRFCERSLHIGRKVLLGLLDPLASSVHLAERSDTLRS